MRAEIQFSAEQDGTYDQKFSEIEGVEASINGIRFRTLGIPDADTGTQKQASHDQIEALVNILERSLSGDHGDVSRVSMIVISEGNAKITLERAPISPDHLLAETLRGLKTSAARLSEAWDGAPDDVIDAPRDWNELRAEIMSMELQVPEPYVFHIDREGNEIPWLS